MDSPPTTQKPLQHEGCSSLNLYLEPQQHIALPDSCQDTINHARDTLTHLCTGKIMILRYSRRVLIEPWLTVLSSTVWQMREVQKPWLFGLVLLF